MYAIWKGGNGVWLWPLTVRKKEKEINQRQSRAQFPAIENNYPLLSCQDMTCVSFFWGLTVIKDLVYPLMFNFFSHLTVKSLPHLDLYFSWANAEMYEVHHHPVFRQFIAKCAGTENWYEKTNAACLNVVRIRFNGGVFMR